MKALNVRSPWCHLIASGKKTIELRTWRTHYRGPLVVVASACAPSVVDMLDVHATLEERDKLRAAPRGVTLAVIEVVNVREATPDDAIAARCAVPTHDGKKWFAWEVRVVRRLKPTPVKGGLSLWNIDETLVQDAKEGG